MKKPYHKPMMYAEKFVLVEHIAGSCGYNIRNDVNHLDLTRCTWDLYGLQIFIDVNTNCIDETYESENVPYDCYQYEVTQSGDSQTVYS